VLAGLYVLLGLSAPGMRENVIQLLLSGMTLQGATIFRAATVFLELTARTDPGRGPVFIVVPFFIIASPLQ